MREENSISMELPIPIEILDRLEEKYNSHPKEYNKALNIILSVIARAALQFKSILQYNSICKSMKQSIVGANKYVKLWGELEQLGVLETKTLPGGVKFKHVGKESQCKKYRLHPQLLSDKIELCKYDYKVNMPVEETFGICNSVKSILSKVSVDGSNTERTKAVHDFAEKRLASKYSITQKGITHKSGHKEILDQVTANKVLRYQFQLLISSYNFNLELIKNGIFQISRNDTNNRIDYNLTYCPSEIIYLLKLNNDSICEIDLSCSQPLLLSHLLSSTITNNWNPIYGDRILYNTITNHLHNYNINTNNNVITNNNIKVPTLLCSSNQGYSNDDKNTYSDIEIFIEKAQIGRLYEYYSFKLYDRCDDDTRDEAKRAFIAALYSNPFDYKSKYYCENFQEVFTDLYDLLIRVKKDMVEFFEAHFSDNKYPELKKYTKSKKKGLKDPKTAACDYLAVRLQVIESSIFIDRILSDLYEKGFDVLPRHDSILCAASDRVIIMNEIKCSLDAMLGISKYSLKSKVLDLK